MPCAFKDTSKNFIYDFHLRPIGHSRVDCFSYQKEGLGE